MVGRDNVTFRFRIDGAQAQAFIKALEADARKFGATMNRVGNESKVAGDKIKTVGQSSAAAAVNFQTATQGMLNLSTAAVQTFTSISNLDRAANRLAQAKLGVSRATDLLNNKELRLAELQEKGLGTTRKAGLLTNEIATARADLAVKTDKARIEEGAMLDIQLLFVTNVANVMISSIQTIKTLRDLQALSTIKATVAEKLLTSSFITSTIVARTSTASFKGMTFAVKGLTFSVRGLMFVLGPIALALTAVTIAMQAYEENWGGFRDTLQSALPFLKESNSDLDEAGRILEQDRVNLDDYNQSIDTLTGKLKTLSTPHRQYLEMMRDAALQLGKNKDLAASYAAQLSGIRSQGFSTPSVGGGLATTSTGIGTSVTGTGGVTTKGVGTTFQSNIGTSIADTDFRPDPLGSGLERQAFQALRPSEKVKALEQLSVQHLEAGNIDFGIGYSQEASKWRKVEDNLIEVDPVKAFKDIMTDPRELEEGVGFVSPIPPRRPVTADMQKFRFGIDIASRMGFDPDTNRGKIINLTGTDIGAVADSIPLNDAIRISNLEMSLRQFTGGRGGAASLAMAAVGGNATQAFQVSSVATPSHILERQARERAHRYSREGIRERILSDRLYYADPAAGKAYTGLDKTQASLFKSYGGEAGLFAPGELDRLEFLFRSGLEEIPTDIPGFSALGLMSLAKGAGVASQAWDTRRSRSGDIEAARINRAAGVANTVLNHSLERLVQGNFGGFESTVLYGINNYFEQPLGGALVEERQIFDTQIDPVLKIGFKAFSKVLQDSKRGLSEINDRIRWSERLSIISVGDSSI